jgi:hypothetical protein
VVRRRFAKESDEFDGKALSLFDYQEKTATVAARAAPNAGGLCTTLPIRVL